MLNIKDKLNIIMKMIHIKTFIKIKITILINIAKINNNKINLKKNTITNNLMYKMNKKKIKLILFLEVYY